MGHRSGSAAIRAFPWLSEILNVSAAVAPGPTSAYMVAGRYERTSERAMTFIKIGL
jgi:hypothetical protein